MATKYFGGMDLTQIGTLTAAAIVSLGLLTTQSLSVTTNGVVGGNLTVNGVSSSTNMVVSDAAQIQGSVIDVMTHASMTSPGYVGFGTHFPSQPYTFAGNVYDRQILHYINGNNVGSPNLFGFANPDRTNGASFFPRSFGVGTPNEAWIFATTTVVGIGGFADQSATLNVLGNVSSTTSTVKDFSAVNAISIGGGSSTRAVCYKADGRTLGFCSTVVSATGTCTCN